MQIQINTGHNINGRKPLDDQVRGSIESALIHFSGHITRVEVHLSDQNSDKKVGHDAMRCIMEARLEGHQPVAVTYQSTSIGEAIDGAANKLSRLIEHTLGRRHRQESRRTDPVPSSREPELLEESGAPLPLTTGPNERR